MDHADLDYTEAHQHLSEPNYPPLPPGCEIEPGRRQLAVGEQWKIGDHAWAESHPAGPMCWYELSDYDVGEPEDPVYVDEGDIGTRAIEEPK